MARRLSFTNLGTNLLQFFELPKCFNDYFTDFLYFPAPFSSIAQLMDYR